MAEIPLEPPRRDELALSKDGLFSLRVITFLEDITQITNESPTATNDEILSLLGGISTTGILTGQLSRANKIIEDNNQMISGLINSSLLVIAENKNLQLKVKDLVQLLAETIDKSSLNLAQIKKQNNSIADIQQLQTGGFNGG